MDKSVKILIAIIVLIALVVVGYFFINDNNNDESLSTNSQSSTASVAESETTSPSSPENLESAENNKAQGEYITVAEYESNSEKYTNSKKVYFFHASWCPICKSIEKDFKSDLSQIPENTVIIEADFDKETQLRKDFGVTTQYTFVQFNDNGSQIAKWSATSTDKALGGIQ